MKRRLAVLLAISLAVSPLCAVPVRAAETAEAGITVDSKGAAEVDPGTESAPSDEAESVKPEAEPAPSDAAETVKPEAESAPLDEAESVKPEAEPAPSDETESVKPEANSAPLDVADSVNTGATMAPETAPEAASEAAAEIAPETEPQIEAEPAPVTEAEAGAESKAETDAAAQVEPEVVEDGTAKDAKMSGIVTEMDDSGNVLHHYIDGEMVRSAWKTLVIDGKHYKFYFDANGKPLVGKKKVDGKIYYFADQNYPKIRRGTMLTGLRKINGRTFYFGTDGVGKTGFQKINGKVYYFRDSRYPKGVWGEMLKGHRYIGGNYYFFCSNGVMRTGWFKVSSGLMAFFGKNGKAGKEGWKKYDYRWFYTKKSGIARTGWLKYNSDIYYLDAKYGGRRLYGPSQVGNKRYFFDEDGRRAKTRGWKMYRDNYYYTYEDGTVAVNTTVNGFKVNQAGKATFDSMDLKAQDYSSNTNYLILVNRSLHKVSIYRKSEGLWSPVKKWYCGDGKSSTPTIEGNFTVGIKMLYFDSGSARCWYATQFSGNYLFHSVLYYQNSWPSTVMDGRVGEGVSHGCVRLQVDNAEWIYDNIPRGTKVIVYH